MIIAVKKLEEFVESIFKAIGLKEKDAQQATDVLIKANLRGISSHGVARLSGYIRLYEENRLEVNPCIKFEHETPSTATLNGDRGLGLVVAPYAMKIAIEKAKKVGTGWVAVKNSNHFGIAGYHAMMAPKKDCIGISLTNASPLVSPTFSKERLLGTNPIAVAIPCERYPDFVLDMATTPAANGKLEVFQRTNQPVPKGWIQTKEGRISTAADGLVKGGAMLPLGSTRTMGSHKGYGLSAVVDILSGVLSGANYGSWVPPFVSYVTLNNDSVGEGIGHFFGAMRIDAFRDAKTFKDHMDNWIERIRKSETVDPKEKVLIPGDPERILQEQYSKTGIPLHQSELEDLKKLSEKLNIKFSL